MHERLDVGVEVDAARHGRLGLRADIRQIEKALARQCRFELIGKHRRLSIRDGVVRLGGIRIRTERVVHRRERRRNGGDVGAQQCAIRSKPGLFERRERDLVQVKVVAKEVLDHPFLAIVEPFAASALVSAAQKTA